MNCNMMEEFAKRLKRCKFLRSLRNLGNDLRKGVDMYLAGVPSEELPDATKTFLSVWQIDVMACENEYKRMEKELLEAKEKAEKRRLLIRKNAKNIGIKEDERGMLRGKIPEWCRGPLCISKGYTHFFEDTTTRKYFRSHIVNFFSTEELVKWTNANGKEQKQAVMKRMFEDKFLKWELEGKTFPIGKWKSKLHLVKAATGHGMKITDIDYDSISH